MYGLVIGVTWFKIIYFTPIMNKYYNLAYYFFLGMTQTQTIVWIE